MKRDTLTLSSLAISAVMDQLLHVVEQRRRRVGGWIMYSEDLYRLMDLASLAAWLRDQLPTTLVQSLSAEATRRLSDAHGRDLVVHCLSITLGPETKVAVVPECLRGDESCRIMLLRLLLNIGLDNPIEELEVSCYCSGNYFYVSDSERKLLASVLETLSRLRRLVLRSAADRNCAQALSEHCPRLRVLDLSQSPDMTDESLLFLMGTLRVMVKGPLVKVITQKKPCCVFKQTLAWLSLRQTRTTRTGEERIKAFFPNLKVLEPNVLLKTR